MNPIVPPLGYNQSYQPSQSGHSVRFSSAGLFASLFQTASPSVAVVTPDPKTPGAQPAKPKLIRGSIGQGIKRAISMELLRPIRGWPQIALHFFSFGLSLVIPVKHFIEGFFGVDSLFFERKWGGLFNLAGALQKGEKHGTLYNRFKEYFFGKK